MSREVTEQENDSIQRRMLEAAYNALGEFPTDVDKEDQNDIARKVILAIVAADAEERAQIKQLKDDDGNVPYVYAEVANVVATAFWLWSNGDPCCLDEVHPHSVAGCRYLGFAQGMAAARAMTDALDLLKEGDEFAFTTRGARHLAPKLDGT